MIEISAIICSHNPRPDHFQRVLQCLHEQTLHKDQWELLVIDNASDRALAHDWDLSWHLHARHVREDELGLTPARLRGIAEATSEVLIFVDDDNVLDTDYLAEALRISREWPCLGVWGGNIIPEFESEPAHELRELLREIAIVDVKSPRWSNVPTCYDARVWGAGMCLRAEVAAAYRRFCQRSTIAVTDRRGKDLIGGGDAEICYVSCGLGLGMGLFPDLRLTHLIPNHRLTEDYLVRLTEGQQISGHLVYFKWHGIVPRAPYSGAELLRVVKNLALRRGVNRRMYLAQCRARQRARAIIAKAEQAGAISGAAANGVGEPLSC